MFDPTAIVGLPAAQMFDVARAWFGDLWQKRFAEALGMIFDKMGHAPGDTVRRVLRDFESGPSVTVDRAPPKRVKTAVGSGRPATTPSSQKSSGRATINVNAAHRLRRATAPEAVTCSHRGS